MTWCPTPQCRIHSSLLLTPWTLCSYAWHVAAEHSSVCWHAFLFEGKDRVFFRVILAAGTSPASFSQILSGQRTVCGALRTPWHLDPVHNSELHRGDGQGEHVQGYYKERIGKCSRKASRSKRRAGGSSYSNWFPDLRSLQPRGLVPCLAQVG